ncbi:Stress response protein nst1 [Lambiella insularis]|nr:Stress response protein nst1 [Lambiella insularis]
MAPSTQRSAAVAPQDPITNGTSTQPTPGTESGDVIVNRKKQKRRQKQAARLAAGQPTNAGPHSSGLYEQNAAKPQISSNGAEYGFSDVDDLYDPGHGTDLYDNDEDIPYAGPSTTGGQNGKAKKKKKNKSRSDSHHDFHATYPQHSMLATSSFNPPPPPPPPPLSANVPQPAHKISKDRIWNTSTQEERERIKEFWLSLEEKDRHSLVKVEKEAVLLKMKEQQKHSCSCTVCGRKRTAIEEELEVLYDAYYVELEQYANHQQISSGDGTPNLQRSRTYSRPTVDPLTGARPKTIPHGVTERPARGRIQEMAEEDDGDDEEYSDEDGEDEEYSDDDLDEEPTDPATDFFNFGNSLTVKGGILTVADDLLKNDGKKFIDMMEQLAERRMQREADAQYETAGTRSIRAHNHGPPIEDDESDDDEDENYGSDPVASEDFDEDEAENMTEEQRMEEGRRMFQIFAARMFEQRVLTAYREKVARERQEKLLEELADESRLDAQKEAKRAKEAQKKKDKKRLQKQAKDEEKARREADKAAEEAALKAIEERKLEEQRVKREELRRKKEAEKRAQDEEKQRREAEKLKKLQEAREQQAEVERRQREAKERDKKKRDDVKRKEREDREAKERETKERKDREAADRREKEIQARSKMEERMNKQVSQPVPIAIPPLVRNKTNAVVPLPLGLQTVPSNHPSPHSQVATPVVPKAPAPIRPRQTSLQDSHQTPPKPAHHPSRGFAASPTNSISQQPSHATTTKASNNIPSAQQPPLSSALPPIAPPPGMHQQYPGVPPSPMVGSAFPVSYGPIMPGVMPRAHPGHESPMFPHQHPLNGPQYRNFVTPTGMPFPPGMNGRPATHARGVQMDVSVSQAPVGPSAIGSPAAGPLYGMVHSSMPSHSRHVSASFEKSTYDNSQMQQTQPIARPAPIKRPSSTPQQPGEDRQRVTKTDVDDLSNHLGSSALLDDADEPLNSNMEDRRGNTTQGRPRPGRLGFGASPLFPDPIGSAKLENFPRGVQTTNWGAPPMPFGGQPMSNAGSWSNTPGSQWPTINNFGVIGAPPACKQLTGGGPIKNSNGFHNIETILRHVEQLKPANEGPIQLRELLQICDTEGNAQNGGGSFTVQEEPSRGLFVKFEPDGKASAGSRGLGAEGDIGSPIGGMNTPGFDGSRGFPTPGGSLASPSGF